MKRYDYFEPIVGDDEPYWTLRYRDVPEPFRLRDAWVIMTDTLPLVQNKKDAFITAFDSHYGRYEINAETYQDFLDMLQEVLLINADTVERLLEVYDSDIAKPILGREETRTLEVTEIGTGTTDASNIDIPADNPDDDNPTNRSTGAANSNVARDEIETTRLSDLGVRPNYETLNGFLDNNRTAYAVFNNLFKNCFLNAIPWYVI
jgi:hypothetical protein